MRTISCWSSLCWSGALLALIGSATLAAADELRWQPDLETARQLAAQNNRLILVHFWAPWCPPCRRLEQNVFQQQGVGPALDVNFVLVKVNLDEHPELQRQFNIRTIPCDVIMTAQGRVLDTVQSKQTAQEYVHQMTQVAASAMGQNAAIAARQKGGALLVSQPSTPAPSAGYCAVPEASGVGGQGSGSPALAQHTQPQQTTSGAYGSLTNTPHQTLAVQPSQSATPSAPQYGDYWSQRAAVNQSPSLPAQPAAPSPSPSMNLYQPQPNTASNLQARTPAPATSPYAGLAGAASMPAAPAVAGPGAMQPNVQLPTPSVAAQPKTPPLGLDGFCPVSLCENELWAKGDPRFGVIHRGRLYLFTGPEQKQRFWAHPDRYSPVAAGSDPVLALDHGQTVEGRREHGVFFEGRVYLFASETSLQRFSQSPQRYASEITQAMTPR
jgi:thiol-disulfide isomerase/thioredoxin/YHS domain-containing protein